MLSKFLIDEFAISYFSFSWFFFKLIGIAAVVGGVFSNIASAANAILSSPSKIGITSNFKDCYIHIY